MVIRYTRNKPNTTGKFSTYIALGTLAVTATFSLLALSHQPLVEAEDSSETGTSMPSPAPRVVKEMSKAEIDQLNCEINPVLCKPAKVTHTKHSSATYYQEIKDYVYSLYKKPEFAMELIAKESGFNPLAINKTSGACGLVQALPCQKLPCELKDIKCQLNWQKGYIAQRYGTIENAYKFHTVNNWY